MTEFVLTVCSNLVIAQVEQVFPYVSNYRSHFLLMLLEEMQMTLYSGWYSEVKARA